MTSTPEQAHPHRPELTDLAPDLHRLAAQSRARLAAVEALREQHRLITEHSRRRLDASRRLLEQSRPSTTGAVLPAQPAAPSHRG